MGNSLVTKGMSTWETVRYYLTSVQPLYYQDYFFMGRKQFIRSSKKIGEEEVEQKKNRTGLAGDVTLFPHFTNTKPINVK